MDNLILVGFGKSKLTDLIEKIGNKETEEELLNLTLGEHLPPVYRAEAACSQEEVLAFLEYVGWISSVVSQHTKETKNDGTN